MPQEPERVYDLMTAIAPEIPSHIDSLTEAFIQGVFKGEFERSKERWPSTKDADLMIAYQYPSDEHQRLIIENKNESDEFPVSSWSMLGWLRTHNGLPSGITSDTITKYSLTESDRRRFLMSMARCHWTAFPPEALKLIKNIVIKREDFCGWLQSRFGFVPASLMRTPQGSIKSEVQPKDLKDDPELEKTTETTVESYHVNFIKRLKELGLKEHTEKNAKYSREFKDIFEIAYRSTPREEIQGFYYVKLSKHITRMFMKGYTPGTIRGYMAEVIRDLDRS